MNCRRIRRLLSAYLDAKSTVRERRLVGLHLECCEECSRTLADMRRFRQSLLGTPNLAVPAEFSQAWRARLRQERLHVAAKPEPNRRFRRFALAAAPAAACVLVMLLGVAILRPRIPVTQEEPVQEPGERLLASIPEEKTPVDDLAPKHWAVGPPIDLKPQQSQAMPFGTTAEGVPEINGGGFASAGGGDGLPDSGTENGSRPASGPPTAAATRSAESRSPKPAPSEPATRDREANLTGTWRVWLLAVGPRPASLKRALVEAGVIAGSDDPSALDVPMLLSQGMDYTAANEMALRIEDAGGRAMVELAP